MKRRGGRVVSSSSTVVGAEASAAPNVLAGAGDVRGPPSPPSPAVSAAAASPAVARREAHGDDGTTTTTAAATAAAAQTLTIPTVNIFSRFQQRRDDFEVDWLMLQEDPAARAEAPPIAAHVAERLRRHQSQLGANRAAAAADRARLGRERGTPTAASAVSGDGLDAVATAALRPPPRQRRPDTYDSAEDSIGDGADTARSPGAVADDADYVPEDRAASQYRRPKATATATLVSDTPSHSSCSPPPSAVPVDAAADATASALAAEAPETEGLTGDYLNFHSTSAAGPKSLDSDALQATVRLPTPTSRGSPRSQQQQQQQQQRRHGASAQQAAGQEQLLVVPLWSAARVARYGGYCRASPLIALHQELTDLVDYLRPTEAEVSMRRYVEMEVGRLVDRLWPGSSVLVYGSMYTHLLLPLSDLDMTLLNVPVPAEEALTVLAREISDAGLCESAYPQVILKTKVPLIKFAHKGSLIDVDISVGAVDGKRNSDCVVRYMNTYPEALPLVLVVKYFVMQRGMHEPYHGGLGSYAATLLVVAFLRQHPIYTTHPELRSMTGLGALLVDFFRMCGQYWSYARVAVSLHNYAVPGGDDGETGAMSPPSISSHGLVIGVGGGGDGDFKTRTDVGGGRMSSPVSAAAPPAMRGPMGPAQAMVEDPVDPSNNAASSLRLFHSLTSMFTYAYIALTADFDSAAADAMQQQQQQQQSPPPPSSSPSPSSEDISARPTLLSRIFHVDAAMVYRRQTIAATYAQLVAEAPAYMAEVRKFRRDEDAGMLQHHSDSTAHSWSVRRLRRRADDPPLLPQQRSVQTLEERLALSRLRGSSPPPPTAATEAPVPATKRRRYESVSSSRTGSGNARSSASHGSDSDSNGSSVRVDVTRKTERSRKLHRS
ncbi:topoisomerase-related function protein-like protein [Novymonas esmeraldas]|uniref:Topoisomerase-related function protein-like protein n=1 Tax=Novymonas esmeraldas TaxID=1808958 RepID=A0AAW0F7T0_9TRYP